MQQTSPRHLVQRLWSCGKYLKDDGVASTDFLAQLAMLLFLKMASARLADEFPPSLASRVWPSLLAQSDAELLASYGQALEALGAQPGMVGSIFGHATLKVRRASTLRRLLQEIDAIQWATLDGDLLAGAYEEIVGKVAEESMSGAGQFFTPRPLIDAIVEVMCPRPGERISDPACGTGGFLIAARRYLLDHYALSEEQAHALRSSTFSGGEIVEDTARLGIMNLLLHGIGDEHGEHCPIAIADSLLSVPSVRADVVFCNPPFGTQRGGREALAHEREDLPFKTGVKQLNFLQHVVLLLNEGGRAAIVVPDNVLFGDKVVEKIRRWLLHVCDVHTLLRLPAGIFSAQGVKTNVLFLQKWAGGAEAGTKSLWVYDLRSDASYSFRQRPLCRADLDDFVRCYCPDDRSRRVEGPRFRCFCYEDLVRREKCNLDLSWRSGSAETTATVDHSTSGATGQAPGTATVPGFGGDGSRNSGGDGTSHMQGIADLRREDRNDHGSTAPNSAAAAQCCLEEFRERFPKGTTIYTLGISNFPCLVKLYAISRLGSLVSLDFMLTRFMRGYRLGEKHIIEDDLPSKGIRRVNDLPGVIRMVQEIGERVWQDRDAYLHESLL